MNLFQSLIYGLVSGISEFLPISSRGHQAFLRKLFGVTELEPLREILIQIAFLLAIIVSCGTYIVKMQREIRNRRNRRSRLADKRILYDYRMIRTAVIPMLLIMLMQGVFSLVSQSFALLALTFAVNGIIVYVPNHLAHGNKDGSKMSTLDALLLGVFASFSMVPGLSRVGSAMSCSIARGADKSKAYNWVLLISIPAIVFWIVVNFVAGISGGFGTITILTFLGYIISALGAFGMALAGIYLMRFMTVRIGFSGFGFYCWGAAFLAFILYLTA